jgi:altronate hydrolase
MQTAIKIHDKDNVAVALETLTVGQELQISDEIITVVEEIPAGHKFALLNLQPGDVVIKYGYAIGIATKPVEKGEWIHTQNIKTGLGEVLDYKYQPQDLDDKTLSGHEAVSTGLGTDEKVHFYGYRRENGKIGIRNELWIIPTVGCVNDVARLIEKKGKEYLNDDNMELMAFAHPYGCSQLGDDQQNTQKILAGLINHPNAAGVLVLGLGCENNNIEEMKKHLGDYSEDRVKFLVCQECEDEIEQGINLIKELVRYASGFQREKISTEELIIGLKCGGSDGLSGITANPTVGAFSDLLIASGGTTILTEVPEMFGAETILMNRCLDQILFDKTVSLINDFKQYFMDHQQPIYENPSPGNKKGGISTLEDKSLGCTQKAGNSPVSGVFNYGEPVEGKGLVLLSSPGNDLVASTALAASGAHIILFTTGRGTPFGAPVPTIKISSNSALAKMKKDWIDFDAGKLLSGHSLSDLSEELFDLVISVASGKKVKSEENGYRDLAIFKQGVTL